MKTPSMIAVPVPTELFVRLVDFYQRKGSPRDPVDVVAVAIEYWLQNAEWKSDDLMPEIAEQSHQGYQWKSLMLPHGTKVRMTYKGSTFYAEVIGDDFVFNGNMISPADFAIKVANNTSRNAWRDLWIKRPTDRQFVLADVLRQELA